MACKLSISQHSNVVIDDCLICYRGINILCTLKNKFIEVLSFQTFNLKFLYILNLFCLYCSIAVYQAFTIRSV
jgi:hypothetical protein